jgi:hypothetical protein
MPRVTCAANIFVSGDGDIIEKHQWALTNRATNQRENKHREQRLPAGERGAGRSHGAGSRRRRRISRARLLIIIASA